MAYLVNFLRDRDHYVVPEVLTQAGLLRQLITDVYYNPSHHWKRLLPSKIRQHRSAIIRPELVRESLFAAALQFLGASALGKQYDMNYLADSALGRLTREIWRELGGDLLLYSGYALESFRAAEADCATLKILFLYHPHYQIIRDLLWKDAQLFPEAANSYANDREVQATWRDARADEEIEKSSAIIAASKFSVTSVQYAGFSKPSVVVPYGFDLDLSLSTDVSKKVSACKFLFVGQGVQRKGIHHLFRAWSLAGLDGADLTCVCGTANETLMSLAPARARIFRGLSKDELRDEYLRADVFVMPSLVEGFGLVYLEAAQHGCYLIYTANTGVPDLCLAYEAGQCVMPGDINELCAALQTAESLHRNGQMSRQEFSDRAKEANLLNYGRNLLDGLDWLEHLRHG